MQLTTKSPTPSRRTRGGLARTEKTEPAAPSRRTRGQSRHKKTELKRMIEAGIAAGGKFRGYEIDPGGTTRILFGKEGDEPAEADLDRELMEWEGRRGR
jgi:hypothetical protein